LISLDLEPIAVVFGGRAVVVPPGWTGWKLFLLFTRASREQGE
jgi:hypothetical protein